MTRSANVLAELIRERLGSDPDLVAGPVGPHVDWRGGGEPSVLILGHHDTVFPLGTLAARPFTVREGRATGPGVFDMKGGIVTALHAVASLADRSGVELLLTCDEEVGSATSRQLIEERAVACGQVLVLEPAADGGALKTGRKGVGMYDVGITGRAAHAGLEPEKGVNALVEAAHQVLAIRSLARPEVGTTVTPTVARAGTAENVVPATAQIRVDVRITSLDEAQRIDKEISGLKPVDPQATISVSGGVESPADATGSQCRSVRRGTKGGGGGRDRPRRWRQCRRRERWQLHGGTRHPDTRRSRRRRRRRPCRPRMG